MVTSECYDDCECGFEVWLKDTENNVRSKHPLFRFHFKLDETLSPHRIERKRECLQSGVCACLSLCFCCWPLTFKLFHLSPPRSGSPPRRREDSKSHLIKWLTSLYFTWTFVFCFFFFFFFYLSDHNPPPPLFTASCVTLTVLLTKKSIVLKQHHDSF